MGSPLARRTIHLQPKTPLHQCNSPKRPSSNLEKCPFTSPQQMGTIRAIPEYIKLEVNNPKSQYWEIIFTLKPFWGLSMSNIQYFEGIHKIITNSTLSSPYTKVGWSPQLNGSTLRSNWSCSSRSPVFQCIKMNSCKSYSNIMLHVAYFAYTRCFQTIESASWQITFWTNFVVIGPKCNLSACNYDRLQAACVCKISNM